MVQMNLFTKQKQRHRCRKQTRGEAGVGGINWEIGIDKYTLLPIKSGFLGGSTGKEPACNAGDPGSIPGLRSFPGERDRLPTPVFLGFPGDSDGKESTCNAGYLGLIPGLGRWEDPLEEGMATHFTIPAWKIPWTEEPGGLQSMGSQTVGHD